MKFAKLLFSLFVFILIPLISTSQNFSKVDSFRIFLNSECSKNHSIRLWNGEFLIIDNNNGIIFKNENTDTLSVIINYKWYTDSFKQRPAISGVISKNDTIGLINQQANKIAYFTEKGEFIDNVRFKEKFGLFGTFVDRYSLFEYNIQLLKYPIFIPLESYARIPLRTGPFGRKIFNYYSARKLIGRFNHEGKLENSFGYYENIYKNNRALAYIDKVPYYTDYKSKQVFVGQEASPIIQVYDFDGNLITKFGKSPPEVSNWQFETVSNIPEYHFFEWTYRIESPIYSGIYFEPENDLVFRICRLPSKDTTMTGNEKYDAKKTTCEPFNPKKMARWKIYSAKPNVIQVYNERFELIKELSYMGYFRILGSDEKYLYIWKKYQKETHSVLIYKYLITDFVE